MTSIKTLIYRNNLSWRKVFFSFSHFLSALRADNKEKLIVMERNSDTIWWLCISYVLFVQKGLFFFLVSPTSWFRVSMYWYCFKVWLFFSMFAYILIFSDVFFSKPYSWCWLSTCERIKEIFPKHFQVNVHAHFGYWLIIWNKIFFRMLIYCVVGVYTFLDIIHKSDVESWRLSCIYIYIWLNSSG